MRIGLENCLEGWLFQVEFRSRCCKPITPPKTFLQLPSLAGASPGCLQLSGTKENGKGLMHMTRHTDAEKGSKKSQICNLTFTHLVPIWVLLGHCCGRCDAKQHEWTNNKVLWRSVRMANNFGKLCQVGGQPRGSHSCISLLRHAHLSWKLRGLTATWSFCELFEPQCALLNDTAINEGPNRVANDWARPRLQFLAFLTCMPAPKHTQKKVRWCSHPELTCRKSYCGKGPPQRSCLCKDKVWESFLRSGQRFSPWSLG